MLKTSRYFFISFWLMVSAAVQGQEPLPQWVPARGITVGVNLAGPINRLMDDNRTGISFLTRVNFGEDMYLIGEAGFENVNFRKERYTYDSNGTFLRIGIEKDILPRKHQTNDNLLMGLQYGFALHEHGASGYTIRNGYWQDYSGNVSSYTLNSHWVEFSMGPRTEVFKNFYMSWKLHIRTLIATNNSELLKPYIVPGFGNGDRRLNAGFSYTLEYLLPLRK